MGRSDIADAISKGQTENKLTLVEALRLHASLLNAERLTAFPPTGFRFSSDRTMIEKD
jgi:hypothetical protein